MSFQVAYYFAAFAIILTHSIITSVKGQCTVQGCEKEDPSMSIAAEIQQLRVELFDHVNKQVQSIHELLNASFQQITSQIDAITRSLQAVDRRPEEHDICIKQVQSIHEILNESVQQTTRQHDVVMTSIHELFNESLQEMKSLQAVARQSQEHDIYNRHNIQSIHEHLNESFQEMTSQHDTVMTSLQAVDQRRLQEHDIYIKQGQSIHKFLNDSFQEMRSHHGVVMTSLQAVDRRRSQEHDIYIKQGQSIHELLNESFQEMKSQHNTVITSLQAVDRRVQEHDISIKNQSRKAWKLANGICSPASGVCDCSEIKASGQTTNGVYEVCVGSQPDRVCTDAFCDLDTNSGASLVFQRRKDGSVNFNRTWADYKQGFGNRYGEFWLGNEMLYLLTSRRNYTLRVDLEDFTGAKRYAEYTTFSISSSTYNYTLTVSGYSGNAVQERDQFGELSCDGGLKNEFKKDMLCDFLLKRRAEYGLISDRAKNFDSFQHVIILSV